MKRVFYIKEIIISLKDSRKRSRFLPMVEKLKKEGIPVRVYTADEDLPWESQALYITDCGNKAAALRKLKLPVLGFRQDGESFAGIDYVMECPEELDVCYLDRVYRRYADIPWDILETQRCVIRESVVEDVESFFEIYQHPDVVRYMEKLYPEKSQEREYIREYIDKVYRYFEFGVWTVIWKETGEIIGRAGLSVREGYELPELGFVIGVPWQGKGVAYEICSAILQYGEEEYDFRRVQALVMPENAASLALCRKLRFAEKGKVQEGNKEYCLFVREAQAIRKKDGC